MYRLILVLGSRRYTSVVSGIVCSPSHALVAAVSIERSPRSPPRAFYWRLRVEVFLPIRQRAGGNLCRPVPSRWDCDIVLKQFLGSFRDRAPERQAKILSAQLEQMF